MPVAGVRDLLNVEEASSLFMTRLEAASTFL
jgi:hypothetical protein